MRAIAATLLILFSLFAYGQEPSVKPLQTLEAVETTPVTIHTIDTKKESYKKEGEETTAFQILLGCIFGAGLFGAVGFFFVGGAGMILGMLIGIGMGGYFVDNNPLVQVETYYVTVIANDKREYRLTFKHKPSYVGKNYQAILVKYNDGSYNLRAP